MAAPTVYDDVAEHANLQGQLFAGKSFWVAQRVPLRNHFLDLIKSNGGTVTMLEKKADYKIADHHRRDCPPGSTSYRFIEKSIKEGELQDPDDYRAGLPVGTARDAGSRSVPSKHARTKYTPDEDRILYKWVRDCEAQNRLASGNEIYKQLEAQHPQHPWQSWRDRYLKQLRNRPPSAFNIPNNAPPSPPTDEPVERTPAPKPVNKSTPHEKIEKVEKVPSSSNRMSGAGKVRSRDEVSVQELGNMFSREDWEELYAFTEQITSSGAEQNYLDAWKALAEDKNAQSAEMWQQYFEKVVRPQWVRDPEWKRQKIRKLVEERHETKASQKATQENNTQNVGAQKETAETGQASTPRTESPKGKRKRKKDEDERFEEHLSKHHKGKASSAYVFFARERKYTVWHDQPGLDYTDLHQVLMAEWNALSSDKKARYYALERSGQHETTKKSPQVCISSSTAIPETPKYITEAYNKALKRLNEGTPTKVEESRQETPRPAKKQRSESATPPPPNLPEQISQSIENTSGVGTHQRPLEISSAESSSSYEQEEQDENMVDAAQVDRQVREMMAQQAAREPESPFEAIDSDVDVQRLEAVASAKGLAPIGSDDYPSDTPTPRAPRHKSSAFDTQAILSSPIPDSVPLSALPRPPPLSLDIEDGEDDLNEENEEAYRPQSPFIRPLSPGHEPPSDTSTTHSMQEFRQSLNEEQEEPPKHLQLPSSAAPSSPSSTLIATFGDPDPPLTGSEIDDFYEEQYAQGYDDAWITAALKTTRCRPELTAEVLEAWSEGKVLPIARGIWSKEDDEDVQSGFAGALARLERKHTMDGWGGITERMRFLEQYGE
ncbi:hypothetical protein CC80DRAFT_494384 [Byssothecium circinans]|uniref:DNA-binding protein RAP1 n=1 Tax=Byssothecium circinans TaxID=147558 RepID=A0A6A5TNM1_9PLEO|nr:hypothetical protein CC80DRAFT_494384 [Byssothecium circinans]